MDEAFEEYQLTPEGAEIVARVGEMMTEEIGLNGIIDPEVRHNWCIQNVGRLECIRELDETKMEPGVTKTMCLQVLSEYLVRPAIMALMVGCPGEPVGHMGIDNE